MATDVEQLIVSMSADLRQFRNEMRKASGVFDQEGRKIEKRQRELERRLSRFGSNIGRSLIPSLGAVAAALSTREVIRYADAWTAAGNRIVAMGTPLSQQATRLRQLSDIAVESRNAFDATVTTYSRLQLATDNLGKSEAELLRITETINKAFVVGGAATSERQAAALQLAQGLASGVLQGDELRSIRENAPLIARAIADVMETTVGGLKKLGEEGKITSDKIIEALERLAPTVDEQFAKTTLTVSDAMTNLQTRFTELLGQLSESGATTALAEGIDLLAKNLENVVKALGVFVALLAPAGLTAAARAAGVAVASLYGIIAANHVGAVISVISAATAAIYLYSDRAERTADILERFNDLQERTNRLVEAAGGGTDDAAAAARRRADALDEEAEALRKKTVADVAAARAQAASIRGDVQSGKVALLAGNYGPAVQRLEETALAQAAELERQADAAMQNLFTNIMGAPGNVTIPRGGAGGGGGTGTDTSGSRADAIAERRAALFQQTVREVADAQSQLSQATNRGRMEMLRGTMAYFDASREATIEQSRLEIREINERARQQLLTLERAREERVKQGESEVSVWAEFEAAKTNIEAAAAARRRAIRADTEADLARIATEERLQRLENANELIESEEDLQRAMEEARISELRGTEDYYSAVRELINNETEREVAAIWRRADEEIAALDERILGHEAYYQRLAQIRRGAENEESAARERNRAENGELDEEITGLRNRQIILADNLRSGLEEIGVAALNGAGSFKQAVAQMLQDIAVLIFRLYVLKPLIEDTLGKSGTQIGGGGGFGDILASAANFAAALFHSGGTVGAGGSTRSVSPAVFAGAPRLHNGLAADEFPAILQRGEQVLSRNQVANGAGANRVEIFVTSRESPRLMSDVQVYVNGQIKEYDKQVLPDRVSNMLMDERKR